jgi:hypothetical protein
MTYPPQGGYPQQQPYPQYSPGYGGPPPPKKSNTGLIVGLVAGVVVVLAALGVTGFVTPGFFLSKDAPAAAGAGKQSAPAPPGPVPGADSVDPARKALIDKFVAALNAGDAPTAVAELCDQPSAFAGQATDAASGARSYQVTKYQTSAGGVDADIEGIHNGRQVKGGTVVIKALDGSPGDCLLNFSYVIVD